jgi:hypothetical protein
MRSPQKLKKACQKFARSINPWGNHTQPGKSVDALVAAPLQTTLHTQIPSTSTTPHEKEIRFKICLL